MDGLLVVIRALGDTIAQQQHIIAELTARLDAAETSQQQKARQS